MSWLRIDDGFTKHPKFEGWTLAQKWAWLEVMEYCARYETRGRIPTDLSLMPRTTTPQLLALAEASGWCDRVDEGGSPGSPSALWVHDWDEFNPPRIDEGELDERVAEAIAQHPEASANDIVRIVGGKRKPTLEAIRRFRAGSKTGSPGTSTLVPNGGSRNHEGTGSRAGRRARPRPVPTTELERSSGDQRLLTSPPTDSAEAPPSANGTQRPAIDVALDRVRNIGAQLPASHLRADITDALGPRTTELDDDDWITLTETHADILAGATQ